MKLGMTGWRHWLRPGDSVVVVLGAVVCVWSAFAMWRGGAPESALIRAGGTLVAEVALTRAQMVEVPGPLGTTRIEIAPGRARVASDPGPRQYCVRQGWLERAGAVAICAPNEVSLMLTGRGADYDSLNY